jgi:hypothetical protein
MSETMFCTIVESALPVKLSFRSGQEEVIAKKKPKCNDVPMFEKSFNKQKKEKHK